MGAKTEALARPFEDKARAAVATLEKLGDVEWKMEHAREHADCTRAETLALFQTGAAKALAVVQSLSDDQLATSGTVFPDAPPMTAEQLIMLGLVGHIADHMGSIRKTVGM